MASPSTVVTRGYGSFGTASEAVTRGYGIGTPPVTLPTEGRVILVRDRTQTITIDPRRQVVDVGERGQTVHAQ